MSLAATLVLATTASLATQDATPARGDELVEARVTVEILAAAIVRQSSGPEAAGDRAPRYQLTRRGNAVLVEYQ